MPLERSNIVMLLGSSGVVRSSESSLKMIVKCEHTCTWCCWHIFKGERVGVDVYQLGEARKAFRCSSEIRLALGVEYCSDPLCFGLNIQLGCVVF